LFDRKPLPDLLTYRPENGWSTNILQEFSYLLTFNYFTPRKYRIFNHLKGGNFPNPTRLLFTQAPLAVRRKGGYGMLWTIFVILLVLWLVGLVSSYTFGGFIHILLVLAVIALIFQLITGRRAV
jgi:hypothetical protein